MSDFEQENDDYQYIEGLLRESLNTASSLMELDFSFKDESEKSVYTISAIRAILFYKATINSASEELTVHPNLNLDLVLFDSYFQSLKSKFEQVFQIEFTSTAIVGFIKKFEASKFNFTTIDDDFIELFGVVTIYYNLTELTPNMYYIDSSFTVDKGELQHELESAQSLVTKQKALEFFDGKVIENISVIRNMLSNETEL